MTISAGVLVDTTDGKKAVSGALHTAHRYIACENLRATITCEQTVSLLVSASASVTRFVDVPPVHGTLMPWNTLLPTVSWTASAADVSRRMTRSRAPCS